MFSLTIGSPGAHRESTAHVDARDAQRSGHATVSARDNVALAVCCSNLGDKPYTIDKTISVHLHSVLSSNKSSLLSLATRRLPFRIRLSCCLHLAFPNFVSYIIFIVSTQPLSMLNLMMLLSSSTHLLYAVKIPELSIVFHLLLFVRNCA